jgi:hypothetical protein
MMQQHVAAAITRRGKHLATLDAGAVTERTPNVSFDALNSRTRRHHQ